MIMTTSDGDFKRIEGGDSDGDECQQTQVCQFRPPRSRRNRRGSAARRLGQMQQHKQPESQATDIAMRLDNGPASGDAMASESLQVAVNELSIRLPDKTTQRHVFKQLQKRTQRQAHLAAWAESLACRQRAIDEEVKYMTMYDEDGGHDSD